jgi:glycerol-3-phosphate dehydrogenase
MELLRRYGAGAVRVLDLGGPEPEKSVRDIFRCCCLYSVREGMAVRLKDLVFLRANLAARGRLTAGCLGWCADMMQAELGWTANRKRSELEKRIRL